jgi:sporulation protein YlmC with PRC-barrel domain
MIHRLAVSCLAVLALGVPSAFAQTGHPDKPGSEGKAPQDNKGQDKKATAKAEPVLMKLPAVFGCEIVNGKQEKLGKLADLIVDPATGRAREAVIAVTNDKKVTVRWELMGWDANGKRFTHEATKEQLERAPAYKAEPAAAPAIKDAKGDKDAKGETGKEGDPEEGKGKSATPMDAVAAAPAGSTKLASTLAGLRVAAGTDDLGTPSEVLAELRTGSLAFVTLTLGDVIGIGGKTYVVPWSAMTVQTGPDQKPLLKIQSMDRKQLENAPRQDGKDNIHNASYRGRVYQFFGVRIPEWEPEHDLLGADVKRGETPTDDRR